MDIDSENWLNSPEGKAWLDLPETKALIEETKRVLNPNNQPKPGKYKFAYSFDFCGNWMFTFGHYNSWEEAKANETEGKKLLGECIAEYNKKWLYIPLTIYCWIRNLKGHKKIIMRY